IAQRFGTDHRSRVVSTDDFDAVDFLAGIFDEPLLATVYFCHYVIIVWLKSNRFADNIGFWFIIVSHNIYNFIFPLEQLRAMG
ncbi:MAG: hypothetical protein EOO43_22000, partial [Flavobacterium sp.]